MVVQKHAGKRLMSLAGAAVVRPAGADAVMRTAAGELARYLSLLTGQPSPVVDALPATGPAVALGDVAASLGVEPG